MPKPKEATRRKGGSSLAHELLEFRDELDDLNACNAFVVQALAGAVAGGERLGRRAATGAMVCAQWLDDRAAELERCLRKIHRRARKS